MGEFEGEVDHAYKTQTSAIAPRVEILDKHHDFACRFKVFVILSLKNFLD